MRIGIDGDCYGIGMGIVKSIGLGNGISLSGIRCYGNVVGCIFSVLKKVFVIVCIKYSIFVCVKFLVLEYEKIIVGSNCYIG